jgi:hypothetical protein
MEDFEEFFEYGEEDLFFYMLENGYLVMAGLDKNNEPLYRMTQKMIEDFPDLFHEHMSFTNELIFDLWTKGFVEVSMDDEAKWRILPNEKTFKFKDHEEELTDEEWLLMEEINDMIDLDNP